MDGDIDIEEHDVLDNPHIKGMFPDLTRVKTEIIDDSDEVMSVTDFDQYLQIKQEIQDACEEEQQQQDAASTSQDLGESSVSGMSQERHNSRGKKIQMQLIPSQKTQCASQFLLTKDTALPSPPNVSQFIEKIFDRGIHAGDNINTLRVTNNTSKISSKIVTVKHIPSNNISGIPNKIILGTKVAKSVTKDIVRKEHLPVFVLLKDWGSSLAANPCFCASCKILFPTENCLDAHKMSVHSFLVAFDKNQSTEAIVNSDHDLNTESESDNSVEMEIFTGQTSKYNFNKNITPLNTSQQLNGYKIGGKRKLSMCDEDSVHSAKSFRSTAKNLENYSKTVAHFDDMKLDKLGEQCYHCDQFFKDHTALVEHLYTLLPNKKTVKGSDKKIEKRSDSKQMFMCEICSHTFTSSTIAKFHKRYIHPEETGDIIKACMQPDVKDMSIDTRNVVKTEGSVNAASNNIDSVKNLGSHKDLSAKKSILEFKVKRSLIIKNPPVPLGVLFKCNRCKLHFLNAHTAYDHGRRCNKCKEHVRCTKCKRKFRRSDIDMHKQQHRVSNSFKVYLAENFKPKDFLCKCPRCNIWYNETFFWDHLQRMCDKQFVHCNTCKLNISRNTYFCKKEPHTKCHKKIAVKYIDKMSIQPSDSDVVMYRKKRILKEDNGDGKEIYKLVYCEACGKCGNLGYNAKHNCLTKSNIICECGLRFTKKTIIPHELLHKGRTLTIENFMLFSAQQKKFIQPPIPFYRSCTNCNVHYMSASHSCSGQHKICSHCSKKFDAHTYKLHVPFHTYNLDRMIREVIRGGGASRQKLYTFYCLECSHYINNYDSAVEHAQIHLINKILPKSIYCNICNRIFDANSFKGHKHNLMHYEVLKFNHRNLFSDAWFELFKGLDQIEVGIILKDSIYKDCRSVQLTLVQEGDPELMLYTCSFCNLIVEKVALEKHVSNTLFCWADSKYRCDICNYNYYSPSTMEAHKALHAEGIKKKDFWIVSINNDRTKATNALLSKAMKMSTTEEINHVKSDISEIKLRASIESASQKKTLIKTNALKDGTLSKIDADTDYESDKFNINQQDDNQHKEGNEFSSTNFVSTNTLIKHIEIFKCINCKLCYNTPKARQLHKCISSVFKKFCAHCKQYFSVKNITAHNRQHSEGAKLNVIFKYFKPRNAQDQIPNTLVSFRNHHSKVMSAKKDFDKAHRSKIISTESDTDGSSVINNEILMGDTAKLDVNCTIELYKCIHCKICVRSDKSLERHHCKMPKTWCGVCNQYFSKLNKGRHQVIHSDTMGSWSIHYYEVENKGNRNAKVNFLYTENSVSSKDNHTNNADSSSNNLKTTVLKCKNCKVCLITEISAKKHDCKSARFKKFCNVCGQCYTQKTFAQHFSVVHRNGNEINAVFKYFEPRHCGVHMADILNATSSGTTDRNSVVTKEFKARHSYAGSSSEYKTSIIDDESADSELENESIQSDAAPAAASHSNKGLSVKTVLIQDIQLYKCVKCKVCLRTNGSTSNHLCTTQTAYRRYCDICKQWFSIANWEQHSDDHRTKGKFNVLIKYFKPKNLLEQNSSDVDVIEKSENRNIEKSEFENTPQYSESEKSSDVESNATQTITYYKCNICKCCFTLPRTFKRHKCHLTSKQVHCKLCKHKFSQRSYNTHKKLNCYSNKVIIKNMKRNSNNSNSRSKYGNSETITKYLIKSQPNVDVAKSVTNSHFKKNYNWKQKVKCIAKRKNENYDYENLAEPSTSKEVPAKVSVIEKQIKLKNKNTSEVFQVVTEELSDYDIQKNKESRQNSAEVISTKVFKLYKCTHCNICVISKYKIEVHRCSVSSDTSYCDVCQQKIPFRSLEGHNRFHGRNKNVKILIQTFKPKQILYSYSSKIKMNTNQRFKRRSPKRKQLAAKKYSHDDNIKDNLSIESSKSETSETNNEAVDDDNEDSEIVMNVDVVEKDKENLISEKISEAVNDNARPTLPLYKCSNCNICVTRSFSKERHVCSTGNFKHFCNICEQYFSCKVLHIHKKLHAANKNYKWIIYKFNPEKIKPGKRSPMKLKEIIKSAFNKFNVHSNGASNSEYISVDDDCRDANLPSDLECTEKENNYVQEHVTERYSNKSRLSRTDDTTDKNVIIVQEDKHTEAVVDFNNYSKNRHSPIIDESKDKLDSLWKDKITPQSMEYKLYVCSKCDVYYLSSRTAETHIYGNKHMIRRGGTFNCQYCKLRYTSMTFARHVLECPFKVGSGRIIIEDVTNSTRKLYDLPNGSTMNADQPQLQEPKANKDTNLSNVPHDNDETAGNNNPNLLSNKIERISALHKDYGYGNKRNSVSENPNKTSAEDIVNNNKFNSTKLNKANADLTGPGKDLIDTVNKAQKTLQVSNETKNPTAITSNDCSENDTIELRPDEDKVSNDITRTTKMSDSYASVDCVPDNTDLSINDRKSENSNPKATTQCAKADRYNSLEIAEKFQVISKGYKLDTPASPAIDTSAQPIGVATLHNETAILDESKFKIKLYSCSVCDVYYLNGQCCQDHLKDHVTLDCREYIQCKLCLLQFLIVDLHKHMVEHHGTEFLFDEVLVEEFVPNERKSRLYSLKDKLQSLVVTTTSGD